VDPDWLFLKKHIASHKNCPGMTAAVNKSRRIDYLMNYAVKPNENWAPLGEADHSTELASASVDTAHTHYTDLYILSCGTAVQQHICLYGMLGVWCSHIT
jgi:hypothetical protein